MAAFVIIIAPPESGERLPVLSRVLMPTLAPYGGHIIEAGPAIEMLGPAISGRSLLVVQFAEAAEARGWLDSPDRKEALTPEEAVIFESSILVENAIDLVPRPTAVVSSDTPTLSVTEMAPVDHPTDARSEGTMPALLSIVGLVGTIYLLLTAPGLAASYSSELRFLFALFTSCLLLTITGVLQCERQTSRSRAIFTTGLVLLVAGIISTLMENPPSMIAGSINDSIRAIAKQPN